jgi:hypothetical protein
MSIGSKNGPREDTGQSREVTADVSVKSEGENMATERTVIPGIVKNGMVVPQNDTPLPEGAHVDILIHSADMPPELQSELDQWDKASDEAWAMIDAWEAEEQ